MWSSYMVIPTKGKAFITLLMFFFLYFFAFLQ
uniref:Uncharacterized protein n=1 Tax=Arundo donax TaxID=35708 RepID=A0A0A9BCJ7_ARUDO